MNQTTTLESLHIRVVRLEKENERLSGLLWAILAADERGQGVNYSEAMNAAARAINYVS